MISENPILQHERVLNRDFITLTVYKPECIPILNFSFSFGRCRITKVDRTFSNSKANLHISDACWLPFLTGSPDTTIYASPIVSFK
jgi:hypothetical protein